MANINLRVSDRTKKNVQKIAEKNGMDLSTCIRMFLAFMEVKGAYPLPLLTINGYTEEEEAELLRRAEGPMVSFNSVEEAMEFFWKE